MRFVPLDFEGFQLQCLLVIGNSFRPSERTFPSANGPVVIYLLSLQQCVFSSTHHNTQIAKIWMIVSFVCISSLRWLAGGMRTILEQFCLPCGCGRRARYVAARHGLSPAVTSPRRLYLVDCHDHKPADMLADFACSAQLFAYIFSGSATVVWSLELMELSKLTEPTPSLKKESHTPPLHQPPLLTK